MGGRLDPTNAIDEPLLTVITAVGLDHQQILGNTLTQIATEKAGIIKRNRPVVLPHTELPVLRQKARQENAPAYHASDVQLSVARYALSGTVFSAKINNTQYDTLTLSLLGKHQLDNAAQVLLAVQALQNEGVRIPAEAVRTGLKNVRWRGRFDVLDGSPTVVLDGAHNVSGAEGFCQNMQLYFPNQAVVLVTGMVKDKDIAGIAHALSHIISRAVCVLCTQPTSPRALPAADMARYIPRDTLVVPAPSEAFGQAADFCTSGSILAVVGSLYLISDYIKERR
jgi:dihydrofolate synthase/folylpolyglutamate synthase